MEEITHAHVVYMDNKNKFFTVPIGDVKSKKNSEHPIKPENDSDFVKTKVYYVKWYNCDSDCEEDHEHFDYYPALILLLGVSKEDIDRKANTGRRLIIPNIIESTESEEPVEQLSQKNKRGVSAAQAMKKKTNNQILQKHKQNAFLASRQSIIDDGVDEENDSVKKSATAITKPISHDENEIVSLVNEGQAKQNQSIKILSDDNEYLKKQLQAKERETENLKKLLSQLKQGEIDSHSTEIADNPKVADIEGIKRALFQEDDCEENETNTRPEENADEIEEISKNSSKLIPSRGSPRPEHKPQRLTIRSIAKINMTQDDLVKMRGNTREGDKNETDSSARKKRRIEQPIAQSMTEELDNLHESGDADSHDHIAEHESLDDDDESGGRGDEGNSGNDTTRTRIRLEPKRKAAKPGTSNLLDKDMNKKIYTEIRDSLKYYSELDRLNRGRKRYEVTADEMIYLGEGITVCAITWFIIKNKKPTIFFKDLVELMWGQKALANRCQDPDKVRTELEERSPMKKLTPKKKRLTYKLFSDHLDSIKMKPTEKMELLMKVPDLFSQKINYLRAKYYPILKKK